MHWWIHELHIIALTLSHMTFATMRPQYLIGKFTDLDAGDGHMVTPLHLACITGHLDIVKMLLNAGAHDRGSKLLGNRCKLLPTCGLPVNTR